MDQTDFGQIKIYEDLFYNLDVSTIKGSPTDCIENGTSYCGLHNDKELPIMVGSKFDKYINPLKIKGYFVINGICKTINNIKYNQNPKFSKDRVYLSDGSKVSILDMFTFTITKNNKLTKWNLPLNWKQMLKYSIDKEKLESHFEIILTVNKKKDLSKVIKNELDLINMCYMFECWLNIREKPKNNWRLLTAGEIFYEYINSDKNIIKSFINNNWEFKGIKNINTISEDMKHYNYLNDLESIRRITLMKNRENVSKDDRMVKHEDRFKICPVQTSDGSICGTVNYLCRDAKIISDKKAIIIEEGNDMFLYINNIFKNKINISFIETLKKENFIVNIYGKICCAYYDYGYIIPSKFDVSYTTSLIQYRTYNPPIRSMFASSMLKQAIMKDERNISHIINNTKSLLNNINSVTTAIMPWYGYNIEDGIVISESMSKKYEYIKTKIYRSNNVKIINKYIKMGDKVCLGDALYKTYNEKEMKTIDIIYSEDEGIVKYIEHDINHIKIIIIKQSYIKVGDKMTSMHGQKGVVSLIVSDDNMPYYFKNNTKIIIELIINPHAFPSRMTMGQIKEMGDKEEEVYIHNKKLINNIIVGKCKYYSLRHQVDDKIQYRNKGNYDIINKQPITGRKNKGGIRFGQMERDILIGIGAWNSIKELWNIDRTKTYWCEKSGVFNPICCKKEIEINQYFLICLSYVRALGFDILKKYNDYSIKPINKEILKETSTIKFGDIDPSDVRLYKIEKKSECIILPICLRSNKLNKLYIDLIKKSKKEIVIKDILKETKSLLKSKNGAYHKLVEGHRVDRCIRSVITPNPNLEIDEVEIPLEANIGCDYGLLNRQPSLNSDSLKLVKLVQSNKKTISFNPLLCKSFNADFDGDEMNIYGIKDKESIKELNEKIIIKTDKTQDYILGDLKKITSNGLTANRKGIKTMIDKESKGKEFNYRHIYIQIGQVNNKEIKDCYYYGLNDKNWYELAIASRESIASIALNTPITGYLQSICIQRLI